MLEQKISLKWAVEFSSPFWATWVFKTFHIKPDSRKCHHFHTADKPKRNKQVKHSGSSEGDSCVYRRHWQRQLVGSLHSAQCTKFNHRHRSDKTLPQIFPLQNNEVAPARPWRHHADKRCWTTPFLFSFRLLHHLHCTLSGAITGQTQWHSGKQHSCKKKIVQHLLAFLTYQKYKMSNLQRSCG